MFKVKQNNALSRSILSIALISILSGCGGTGQDSGTVSLSSDAKTYSGIVVDGYVARSLVFLDYDNNATRDPWEPFAFTDDQGYYSYNPITETDYCASDASAEQAQYCLRSDRDLSRVTIRIDGGYDVLTGEPFLGQMSRKVDVPQVTDTVDSVISPLTTLVTNTDSSSERSALLYSLSISEEDLDVDYLNTDGAGTINTGLLNKALKVHKAVTILSDRMQDTYTDIGNEPGTPNDLTSSIYDGLREQILSTNLPLNEALASRDVLDGALANAELSARVIYTRRDLVMPTATTQDSTQTTRRERAISQAQNISTVVDAVINPSTPVNSSDVAGRARAVEALVIKSLEEGVNENTTFSNAVTFFLDDTKQDFVEALVDSLSTDGADLSALVDEDFIGTDFDSEQEITALVQPPEGATAFNNIANRQIRVSDLDLGIAPNDLNDSEVEVYFQGERGATSGSFVACVKYINEAKADGTLGEGNTRGEVVNGFWSLLNAEQNQGSSYSLLMTITFLGATYQSIMKPSGTETRGDITYEKVRFDYGDEIKTWHSENGFTDIEALPTSDAECQQRLPSRIGI